MSFPHCPQTFPQVGKSYEICKAVNINENNKGVHFCYFFFVHILTGGDFSAGKIPLDKNFFLGCETARQKGQLYVVAGGKIHHNRGDSLRNIGNYSQKFEKRS